MGINTDALLGALKEQKIVEGLEDKLDPQTGEEYSSETKDLKNSFIKTSYKQMLNIIKKQAATKESSTPLLFEGLDAADVVLLTIWETENNFNLLRASLAEELTTGDGKMFLGFRKNNIKNKIVPFISKISRWDIDPLFHFTTQIEYDNSLFISANSTYSLRENYTYDYKLKKYVFTRIGLPLTKDGRVNTSVKILKGKDLPSNLQLEGGVASMIVDDIDGVVALNNLQGENDIANISELSKTRGKIFYEIHRNMHKLAPKVLVKASIADEKEESIEKKFEDKVLIYLKSRGSQIQNPFGIFDPSVIYDKYTSLIEFYEDEILWAASCSSPLALDKKAQTNDLETSSKNEDATNYNQFKAQIRSATFSQYFTKIAKQIGIKLGEDEIVKVTVELSAIEKRIQSGDQSENNPKPKTDEKVGGDE